MILVDTSVWIDWLADRPVTFDLAGARDERQVAIHPAVYGELALGHLGPDRAAILRELATLPTLVPARDGDVLDLVDHHGLQGTGIGWVDAHLLAACHRNGATLWTHDKRLAAQAHRLHRDPSRRA